MNILLLINVTLLVCSFITFIVIWKKLRHLQSLSGKAKEQWDRAMREIETERRESALKIKDEIYKKRSEFELEVKRERIELDRISEKVQSKISECNDREQRLETVRRDLLQRERELTREQDKLRVNEVKLKKVYDQLLLRLENISSMTQDEAKKVLQETLESEVRLSSEKWIQKVEEDTKIIAKQKAIEVVLTAMQRYTVDQIAPHTSGVVHLPNEDMKGRIIGKEGRNIKALELATGMEFVIGETPEIITISGFNPVRREVARRSLERLIADGRINPTRIEETVLQCEAEINDIIEDYGKETILEFNLRGVHPEIVTLLGKLFFRTSYSQNVLVHSKEVALFARMIAQELGLNPDLALRAGLLHDIGKAVSAEVEGPHAQIGGDIAKRCGEDPIIVNAIAAHHEEVPFTSVYAPIILIADMLSAARPGARRETFTAYIKRLEKLEEIAHRIEGVKKAYALQAGREIRIIVEEDLVDDDRALMIARTIARAIEQEIDFPGQIKVNVIREFRSIEYAK
ncbi:MAG TPA: ribonuclease Y [Candidatus Babeliales bacterium]|nr:ribonuclease Y [Candidatus Babeliales bacterium]